MPEEKKPSLEFTLDDVISFYRNEAKGIAKIVEGHCNFYTAPLNSPRLIIQAIQQELNSKGIQNQAVESMVRNYNDDYANFRRVYSKINRGQEPTDQEIRALYPIYVERLDLAKQLKEQNLQLDDSQRIGTFFACLEKDIAKLNRMYNPKTRQKFINDPANSIYSPKKPAK